MSSKPHSESRASRLVWEIFESGRTLAYIRSAEEQRVARVLCEIARGASAPLWTWSLTEGMHRGAVDQAPAEPGTESARGALDFILAHQGAAIFHLKDFHEALRDSAEIRRRLRDVHEQCANQRKFVVISSPVHFIPDELDRSILFLELRPPDQIELMDFLRDEAQRAGAPADGLPSLVPALQGLTLDESRYAMRRALSVIPQLGPECLP